jgi:hypothetical protein
MSDEKKNDVARELIDLTEMERELTEMIEKIVHAEHKPHLHPVKHSRDRKQVIRSRR